LTSFEFSDILILPKQKGLRKMNKECVKMDGQIKKTNIAPLERTGLSNPDTRHLISGFLFSGAIILEV
jgi:hypothetical protein